MARQVGPATPPAPAPASRRQANPPQPPSGGDAVGDAVLVVCALAPLAAAFARWAPEAYMDEPFHVGQTAAYYDGRWGHWDPKITTPPGLYALGVAWAAAVNAARAALGRPPAICGPALLRQVNLIGAGALFAAAAASRRAFSPAARDAPAVAALILTLPTIFFFAFLYYTDVWGLALLLAADAAAARRAYGVSAAAAAASVLFRQTNAVWACVVVLSAVMREADASRPRGSPALGAHAGPARQLAALLCAAAARPAAVLAPTLPLLAVPVAFVAFVAWNGGVVLGDKSNHAVTLHPAQAAYAAAFAAAALAPAHAAASLPRPTLPGARTLVVAASAATLALTHGVVEHAFLVSDNRHYTFYLWRAFKRSGAGGTAALGVAAGAGGAWVGSLLSAGGAPALWRLGLAAAAALALLPSPLLEFRYFAPLVSLAATRAPPLVGRARLAFALAAFGAVNAGTTYVFLARPFVQNGEVKRFMW